MNRLVILALFLATWPAAAQTIESAFTDFDVQKCRHIPGEVEEDYGEWHCQGYGGMPAWMGTGDQRVMISFGPHAQTEPAAHQTLAVASKPASIEEIWASDFAHGALG